MRVAGVVSEYNPFHNGHKYLIDQIRLQGYDTIVAAMSGNITQRGDFACVEKRERVKAALECGVDLCVEIPFPWACASAQDFAMGGISLLNACDVDAVFFGAESDDVDKLKAAAAEIETAQSEVIKENIRMGMTYASALSKAVSAETAELLSTPNNLLAMEYIRAINKMCPDVKPISIKRIGPDHDSDEIKDIYSSASHIRELLRKNKKEAFAYVPEETKEILFNADLSDVAVADRSLLNSLRNMSKEEIASVRGVSEGLENRIYEAARSSLYFADVADAIKTKRYTLAKIRRILMNCLVGNKESIPKTPPYVRVLGFDEKGREVLAGIKKNVCVLTKPSDYVKMSKEAVEIFETEIRATELFALSMPPAPAGRELRYTPVVK